MKFLGGVISRDKGFIEGLAMRRDSKAVELMHLLPRLRDPQSELKLNNITRKGGLNIDVIKITY